MTAGQKVWAAHLALLAGLLVLQWLLPPYQVTNMARIMVLAVFAIGYNLAFGYTGMLSLGHALFFAAGMYAAGLPVWHWGIGGGWALILGAAGGAAMALAVGLLALRTAGVAFMIVTLMFAQAGYLTILYFRAGTGGDDGFPVPAAGRRILGLSLSDETTRYWAAWLLCAAAMIGALALVRSRFGRVMVALRENEERSRMLGYNPFTVKLTVMGISGLYSGAAGAAFGLYFGYVGASFAMIQYSILPMLYVLMGGAGTVAGGLVGAAVIFYLIDAGPRALADLLLGAAGLVLPRDSALFAQVAGFAGWLSSAWLLVVGLSLIVLVLFAPRGILGWVRSRLWRDLP